MAPAQMREVTLLGLFFRVPLGYTLLAHQQGSSSCGTQVRGVRVDQLSRIHRNAQIARRDLTVHIFFKTNSQPISLKPAAPMAFSFPLPILVSIHLSLRALVIQSVSHSFVIIIRNLLAQLKSVDRKPVRFYPECPCVLLHQSYLLKLYSLSTLNPAYMVLYRALFDKFSL